MYASPKRSALLSGLLHAAAIVLVLAATSVKTPPRELLRPVMLTGRDLARYLPRSAPDNGGGGGGARDPLPATRGALPPRSLRPFVPPAAAVLNPNPRLTVEPAILGVPDIVVPAGPYGDPNGILGVISSGPGKNGGMGSGDGGGDGPGHGSGAGPGGGGGVSGDGQGAIRGAVTAPVLLYKIEPDYSEEARKARVQGLVLLRIEVSTRGEAQNIEIVRGLGLGLDERAVQAVRRWRFRPGSANGKPVVAPAIVEVRFQLL